MTRDDLAFATDLALGSVPLGSVVILWCALTWDSPTYIALSLLAVAVSFVVARPATSPGPDQGISPPDAGDSLHASGGLSKTP